MDYIWLKQYQFEQTALAERLGRSYSTPTTGLLVPGITAVGLAALAVWQENVPALFLAWYLGALTILAREVA